MDWVPSLPPDIQILESEAAAHQQCYTALHLVSGNVIIERQGSNAHQLALCMAETNTSTC